MQIQINEIIKDLNYLKKDSPWGLSERLDDYINKLESKNKNQKQRTLSQNNSMWLYLAQLSQELNEAGFDMKQVIKVDINWDKDMACRYLWKPILKVKFNKISTTEQTKIEVSEVYEILNRLISEKFGIHIPFPSDTKIDQQNDAISMSQEVSYPENDDEEITAF